MPILDKIAFSNLSIMKIWYDDDNEMKEILGNQEKKTKLPFATMNIFCSLHQNLNLKLLQTQV